MNLLKEAVREALKQADREQIRKKLKTVLNCRPTRRCRNVQLCIFCIRCRQREIAAKIEKYRRRKGGYLYGFLRTEEFLLDSFSNAEAQYAVLKDRIRRIRRTMPEGASRLRGWISRYELVRNRKENCWSLRVVTLLLFRRRNITTRSPYWAEKTVWEEDGFLESGTPRHQAGLKYLGQIRHRKQSESKVMYAFQLPEFYKLSADAMLSFLTLTGSTQTWVTGGEIFQKAGKAKKNIKPVRKYKTIKCRIPVQIAEKIPVLSGRRQVRTGRSGRSQEAGAEAEEAGCEAVF